MWIKETERASPASHRWNLSATLYPPATDGDVPSHPSAGVGLDQAQMEISNQDDLLASSASQVDRSVEPNRERGEIEGVAIAIRTPDVRTCLKDRIRPDSGYGVGERVSDGGVDGTHTTESGR